MQPVAVLEQASLEKLVESSLSNLTEAPTKKGAAFKFKQSTVPTSRGTGKTYSPSTKACAWTTDSSALEGVFAQHSQGTQRQQEEEFGEFHSGPTYPGTGQGVLGVGQGVQVSGQGVRGSGQVSSGQGALLSGQSGAGQPPTAKLSSTLDASRFPAVYLEVHRRCVQGGDVSTDLLFPILLSSQLPSRTLRDLWALANRAVPGKLNQTELFVLLGLVGLVQVCIHLCAPHIPPTPPIHFILETSNS